jgi:hypothetical protein
MSILLLILLVEGIHVSLSEVTADFDYTRETPCACFVFSARCDHFDQDEVAVYLSVPPVIFACR